MGIGGSAAGIQALSGNNTYGGSTTINAGILDFVNHGALPSTTTVTVGPGRV